MGGLSNRALWAIALAVGVLLLAAPASAEACGDPAYHGPRDRHRVALSFDFDLGGRWGARIHRYLTRQRVSATYFAVGRNVRRDPALYRRIARSGQQVGNHSWGHPDLTAISARRVGRQLQRTNRALRRATGVRPSVARPPFGRFDSTVLSKARKKGGLTTVMWDTAGADWATDDHRAIARRVRTTTRPGSIVLLHDAKQSYRATRRIVPQLRADGYRFVTVGRLLRACERR